MTAGMAVSVRRSECELWAASVLQGRQVMQMVHAVDELGSLQAMGITLQAPLRDLMLSKACFDRAQCMTPIDRDGLRVREGGREGARE